MAKQSFDLTPDPRVLIALTHTPLQPLDALCELIDNSIDSFADATRAGTPVDYPLIVVDIPGSAEVNRGDGTLRLRDNGPGLTPDDAEKAIRAGYSGKRRFGSLGLFGMGFNISTGKLGQRTTLATTRAGDRGLSVTIDLPQIIDSRSYEVPFEYFEPTPDFVQGTRISIAHWWPQSNPNHGFMRKLAGYPKDVTRQELGRRYATILRQNRIRLVVNGEPCVAFEHCVWDKSRFVERQGRGIIPAQFSFDEVLAIQTRCVECDELIVDSGKPCPQCGNEGYRTLEERVHGWVGIQRFDDKENYGIDLIRNGRAIRTSEQAAFFEYTDEFKKTIKDYPIDGTFGRIVGEVHLDHVPVDFLKKDFQRSEDEWRRAMSFLRGDSSLQPQQPGADTNSSPIFKLYQGYRRVRNYGKRDMYMGYWDGDKAARISRDVEKDLYQKFTLRLPGYFDDAEWWQLVEQADQPPATEIITCPNDACGVQLAKGTETCTICGTVIVGKECIACKVLIPSSAFSCDQCGQSQLPEIITPWHCSVCSAVNPHDVETCLTCARPHGSLSPVSREYLIANSDLDDSLSLRAFVTTLADGSSSDRVDVDTYRVRQPIHPRWNGPAIPAISFHAADRVDFFLDANHRIFRDLEIRPEYLISAETAGHIFDMSHRLISGYPGSHSVSSIAAAILEQRFAPLLEDSAERVQSGARSLFDGIKLLLSKLPDSATVDLYDELTEDQQKSLVANMLAERRDLASLAAMSKTSAFLRYVDEATLVEVFRKRPQLFFDKNVFRVAYQAIDVPEAALVNVQASIRDTYKNCLEDLALYVTLQRPNRLMTTRARAALDLLLSEFE